MGLRKMIISVAVIFSAICFLLRCSDSRDKNNSRVLLFVDSFPITNIKNLYIYHLTTFFHEGSESYFAVASNSCDVYHNEKATFAKTPSYSQIDTIIAGKVYISSDFKVGFYYHPDNLQFEILKVKNTDPVKHRLKRIVDENCN